MIAASAYDVAGAGVGATDPSTFLLTFIRLLSKTDTTYVEELARDGPKGASDYQGGAPVVPRSCSFR